MNPKDIDLKPKINPLIDKLPAYLKDPANYEKIQKQIIESFISTCSHGAIVEWAACKKCTDKMLDRRRLLKKLGFKNPAQYFAWKKVHEKIKKMYPLVDWSAGKNKLNLIQ